MPLVTTLFVGWEGAQNKSLPKFYQSVPPGLEGSFDLFTKMIHDYANER